MREKPKPFFPPPTFKDAPARMSRVRVTKPNEMGEIISKVIPAKDFRPKLPSKPKVDHRRICLIDRGGGNIGPTGRSVVYMSTVREQEIDYWRAFDHILTPTERRHLAADNESTSILRPIPPAWKVGDRMYVASNMEAEVVEITESERGHGTVFKIHDYRVLYMKRGVIGPSHTKTDEDGFAPPPTADQIEKARLESAYTTSPSQSIDEGGGLMEDEVYRRIHVDQPAGNALRQRKRRVGLKRRGLEERLAEAKDKGRDSTVRYLKRQLDHLSRKAA